jgi:signal transduction histidine kinase
MGSRLLIVEDDSFLCDGLLELLRRESYEGYCALTAGEAAEKLKNNAFDLIILDVMLPDCDGFALCAKWRQQGLSTPILFLTACDDEVQIVRGLDAGGDDYITKPFRLQELLSRIRALLRRNAAASYSCEGLVVDMTKMAVTLDGLSAQLLCGVIMTAFIFTRPAGIALLFFALMWLIVTALEWRARCRKLAALQQSIEIFTESGREPAFSLRDDEYAELENSIAELAHITAVQREAVQKENRDTTDFIADVSHQLKTPLASLRLYSELQSGPHTEKQLMLIDRMEKLIYSLLRLQKLRAGAYELKFMPHDAGAVIRDVWEELAPLYTKKKFVVSGDSGPLRCDEYWMGEAFKNVIKNACEHTAEDGSIGVVLSRMEKSILLTVEDDGGGVTDEELPRLFRRFYSPPRQKSGTGLGLAITRTIVEKHHGSVSAENTGAGLRVTVCLPLLDGILPIPSHLNQDESSLKKT